MTNVASSHCDLNLLKGGVRVVNLLKRIWLAVRSSLSSPERWLVDMFGGRRTTSGAIVNEQTAMTYSAFWACVRAIAKPVASLPLHLYERMDDGRRRARSEEHTSELQSREKLVCRLLLEKKKINSKDQ